MINLFVIACGLIAFYVGQKLLPYVTSMFEAKAFATTSPLPSVNIYCHRDSMLFWLFSPWIAPIIERFPFNWGHWVQYARKDFSWLTKGQLSRDELGSDTYWTVGPGGPALWSSDADVISQVVHRWRDFSKLVDDYVALNVYGQNVVTTEGADWQRHRKITGPPFNERNSGLVFQQTVDQAKAMLASFIHDADGKESAPGSEPEVKDLIHWTMTLTLNVISGASFNLKAAWPTKSIAAEDEDSMRSSSLKSERADEPLSQRRSLPFHESFALVMNNIRILIGTPAIILRNSPFRHILKASDDFQFYMHEMIEGYRKAEQAEKFGEGKVNAGDLLSNIVKASTANNSMSMSESEVIGNIYIFVLAGHETTASTLKTGLIRLACDPDLQALVQKEIDDIWADKSPGEDLSYDDYPKMRVIMALMLEVLRIYPPVVWLPKYCHNAQTLNCDGKVVQIPPNSRVNLDIVSVQRNPKYWGSDAQYFKPSRWLMPSPYTAPPETLSESTAHADLLCPQKGAFLAFSGGFRGCLGRKFAQVEFCTLMAVLLKDHSIELVSEHGAGWKETRKKALRALDDRQTGLAMRMKKNVKVRFVRRGAEGFPSR